MTEVTHPTDLSPSDRELLEHLRLRLEELERGTVVDACCLYGSELWDELLPHECRPLGRRISSLVKRNRLALQPAGFDSARHNLYRRT